MKRNHAGKTACVRPGTISSRDLYAGGKGDYLDVLTAQASSLSAETEYASHRAAMAKDAVSLVRALGGGWTGENMTQP